MVATTSFGSAGVGAPLALGAGAPAAGASAGALASGAGAGAVVSVLVVASWAPAGLLRRNPAVETKAMAPASRAARNDTFGISRDLSWFRGSRVRPLA